jgi:hypothetical protein
MFSNEPWKMRVPGHGFSPPAQLFAVQHEESSFEGDTIGRDEAFELMGTVGDDARLHDSYFAFGDADDAEERFDDLASRFSSLQILTQAGKIDQEAENWAKDQNIPVKTVQDVAVHDRFLVGERRALIIGHSINALGKQLSFIVLTDNEMRQDLDDLFYQLWEDADAI